MKSKTPKIYNIIIFILFFENTKLLEINYSSFSIVNETIHTQLIKINQYNNNLYPIYIFDNGSKKNEDVINYLGNNLNTEFIYDEENNILFVSCLTNEQIGKIDYNTRYSNFYSLYSNYQYNDYKCSISIYKTNDEKFIIMTQTYLDSNDNNKYKNMMFKINYSMSSQTIFSFTVLKTPNLNYNLLFQCISIESNREIFCAYIENKIYGFYINSNFNGRDNIQELIVESNDCLYFKLFPFNENSILMFFLENNLNTMHVKLLTSNNKQAVKRHLYLFKENALNYLDLISINYMTDSSFIVFIGNTHLTYFWCVFTPDKVDFNSLIINGNDFNNIIYGMSIYINSKIKTYFVVNNNNINELFSHEIEFPSQFVLCENKELLLFSNENNKFNINDILTNFEFDLNSISFIYPKKLITFSIDKINSEINYSAKNNGIEKS